MGLLSVRWCWVYVEDAQSGRLAVGGWIYNRSSTPFKWKSRPLQGGGCPRKGLRREQGTDPSADFFEAVRFIEVAPVTPDGCIDVPVPEVLTKC